MRPLPIVSLVAALITTPVVAQDCSCTADANGDNLVDVVDLLQVLGDWGCMDCPQSDLDGSGVVEITDLLLVLGDWGCGVGMEMSSFEGFVTNTLTGDPLIGARVFVGDCPPLLTDEFGFYEGDFPVGQYEVSFEAMHFVTQDLDVILFPDFTTTLNVALEPVAPVVVTIAIEESVEPGGVVHATAIVDVLDGSTVEGFMWHQVEGAPAVIEDGNMETATITLATREEYKAQLIEFLMNPPISAEELPPGIELPEEFNGGLQNRFQLVGIAPLALEEAGLVGLEVEVMTTSGTYASDEEAIHTMLPWFPTRGIRNVPIGETVLLFGKDQASYDWELVGPDDSDSTLIDPFSRAPEFVPDMPGLYSVSVTDIEGGAPLDIFVFAGTWRGSIVGMDDDGHPITEDACTNCHVEGGVAADTFTPWSQTGHARILSDNLNTSTHYGPNCFACHSVGFNPLVDNGGMDEAADYQAFLDSGLINNPSPDNWATMLAEFPASARMANIQCENCHGPQNGDPGVFSPAHTTVFSRISLSSDVCATCHGEPMRHARFQQWQLSGHGNYELAIDESESGNCSRCHTANGFVAWMPVLTGEVPGDPTASIEVTWTADDAHPQTCVACHDPHDIGTKSGDPNNAKVRIDGNTPMLIAGFKAYGVGRGAVCMTCHNTRRGLRNDAVWPDLVGTSETARAPHGGAQTDMIMGQNAYLVEVGDRGNHSYITDTCTNCHMSKTSPPAALSYNQSGTNHTFAASLDICSECHGEGFDPVGIQTSIESNLMLLAGLIEVGIAEVMDEQLLEGNTIDIDGLVMITAADDFEVHHFSSSHGRQAVTVTVNGVDYEHITLNSVDVVAPDLTVLGLLYDFADEALPKSGWNYLLVTADGSMGVHNPTYAFDVVVSAIESLDPGARIAAPLWYTQSVPVTEK